MNLKPRLLIDTPSDAPVLRFPAYAGVLEEIIVTNEPRFAVGVFGNWGTGKTTLLRNLKSRLEQRPDTITVDFNAWTFEKEKNLIVPLLDTLHEALMEYALDAGVSKRAGSAARTAARKMGQVVASLVAGLEFEAGVTDLLKVKYSSSDALNVARQFDSDNARKKALAEAAALPKSVYYACFRELRSIFGEFFSQKAALRVVVFVDDLDRCLPEAALTVLESMKLLFDQRGFVFVVGLDRAIVELAIEARYRSINEVAKENATERISGERYIEKIFQVPFSLPPIGPDRFDELLDGMLKSAGYTQREQQQLKRVTRPHLQALFRNRDINPRELKRYLNLFVLQSATLAAADMHLLLTLQTVAFRPDWKHIDRSLRTYKNTYVELLKLQASGNVEAVRSFAPDQEPAPPDLIEYLKDAGKALLHAEIGMLADHLAISEHGLRDSRWQFALTRIIDVSQALGTLNVPFEDDGVDDVRSRISKAESSLSGFKGEAANSARMSLERIRRDLESTPATPEPNPELLDRQRDVRDGARAEVHAITSRFHTFG